MSVPADPGLLRAVAHHEAGHVVVDVVLGLQIERVVIDSTHGGRTDISGWDRIDLDGLPPDECRQRLEPGMLALLAGPFAEEQYAGEFDPLVAAADLSEVAAAGYGCVERLDQWPSYEGELSERARTLVLENWEDIHQLAGTLEQRGSMDAADLDAWFEENPTGSSKRTLPRRDD